MLTCTCCTKSARNTLKQKKGVVYIIKAPSAPTVPMYIYALVIRLLICSLNLDYLQLEQCYLDSYCIYQCLRHSKVHGVCIGYLHMRFLCGEAWLLASCLV